MHAMYMALQRGNVAAVFGLYIGIWPLVASQAVTAHALDSLDTIANFSDPHFYIIYYFSALLGHESRLVH